MRTATTGVREAGPSPADEARSRQVPHLSGSRCSALTRLGQSQLVSGHLTEVPRANVHKGSAALTYFIPAVC